MRQPRPKGHSDSNRAAGGRRMKRGDEGIESLLNLDEETCFLHLHRKRKKYDQLFLSH